MVHGCTASLMHGVGDGAPQARCTGSSEHASNSRAHQHQHRTTATIYQYTGLAREGRGLPAAERPAPVGKLAGGWRDVG
jgi:hypothetical protein